MATALATVPAMSRAYAALQVKAADGADGATGRRFSGMATTPTPDRVEDVIEPLGVSFKNPLPLLLFHSSQMPVGSVRFGKPTADGVPFDAWIPEVTEAGDVKTLTDKAAHLVKYGLIKGVSIGFRPLEDGVELLKSGGIRFLKTEVVELSLVPIPANVEATITTIKSFDTDGAAFGIPSGMANRPGVAGVMRAAPAARRDTTMAKTIAEQVKEWEATRQAKAARRSELMDTANAAGETLEGPAAEEYDGLEKTIKGIDQHLVRLAALEDDNKRAAVPVAVPDGSAPVSAAHAGATYAPIQVRSVLPPGIEFARLVICKMASFDHLMKGEFVSALDVARQRYPGEARIQNILKAAVVPAMSTLADGPWAGTLVEPSVSAEFIEYLRPKTIVGRIPGLRRAPFNVRFNAQTSGGTGTGWERANPSR